VPLLWHTMLAEVIEHRGFIGVDGREMIRIQPLDPADDRGAFDIAVADVEIAPGPVVPAPAGAAVPGRRGTRGKERPALHLPVGTRVRVQLPNSILDMEVVEDRGVVDGQQIVRVQTLDGDYIQAHLEVAADDVEVLSLPKARRGRAA
jgi:hypothetical protein